MRLTKKAIRERMNCYDVLYRYDSKYRENNPDFHCVTVTGDDDAARLIEWFKGWKLTYQDIVSFYKDGSGAIHTIRVDFAQLKNINSLNN